MTYRDIFEDNRGNLIAVVRAFAKGMDEQEAHLERVRVALGFHEDWSPAYDRKQRSGTSSAVKWYDKAMGINGRGDLHAIIAEMCAWMDEMAEKRAEIEARLVPADEMQEVTTAACPKCGKTGRGLAMHMKHCVGKAA